MPLKPGAMDGLSGDHIDKGGQDFLVCGLCLQHGLECLGDLCLGSTFSNIKLGGLCDCGGCDQIQGLVSKFLGEDERLLLSPLLKNVISTFIVCIAVKV